MSSERLAAITDGIIAIAATIMVLEMKIPTQMNIEGLVELWPVSLAHFNSFLLIFVLWYNHYLELKNFSYLSVQIVFLNAIWLAFISMLPFSTGWISSYPNNVMGQVFYIFNLVLCFGIYRLIMVVLVKEKADTETQEVNSIKKAIPIYLGILIAFIVAFYKPLWSLFIEFAVILYNVFLLIHHLGKTKSH